MKARIVYIVDSEDGIDFQHIVQFIGVEPDSEDASALLGQIMEATACVEDAADLLNVEVQYAPRAGVRPHLWRAQ